jgi:hypothetical protein
VQNKETKLYKYCEYTAPKVTNQKFFKEFYSTIKSRWIRWAWHVTHMEIRNAHKILVVKTYT